MNASPSWILGTAWFAGAAAFLVSAIWLWEHTNKRHWAIRVGLSLFVICAVSLAGYAPIIDQYRRERAHSAPPVGDGEGAKPLEVLAWMIPGDYPPRSVAHGITWLPGFTELRVSMKTSGDVDYNDIDLLLEPDQPIVKISQITTVPNVKFIGDVTQEETDIGGVIAKMPQTTTVDAKGSAIQLPTIQLATPRYKVQCPHIPGALEVVMAIAEPEAGDGVWSMGPAEVDGDRRLPRTFLGSRADLSTFRFKRTLPTNIRISGTYRTNKQNQSIDEIVSVWVHAR